MGVPICSACTSYCCHCVIDLGKHCCSSCNFLCVFIVSAFWLVRVCASSCYRGDCEIQLPPGNVLDTYPWPHCFTVAGVCWCVYFRINVRNSKFFASLNTILQTLLLASQDRYNNGVAYRTCRSDLGLPGPPLPTPNSNWDRLSVPISVFFFGAVLRFELRASHLLSRYSPA